MFFLLFLHLLPLISLDNEEFTVNELVSDGSEETGNMMMVRTYY